MKLPNSQNLKGFIKIYVWGSLSLIVSLLCTNPCEKIFKVQDGLTNIWVCDVQITHNANLVEEVKLKVDSIFSDIDYVL